jgi:superfamily II DNA/RNA helicase
MAAKPAESETYAPTHTFADFGLHPLLETNLAAGGITAPTPIQDRAIKPALEKRDVIGVASTGTGKTLAFVLPVLHKLLNDRNESALIIAPTRELAQQIEAECKIVAKGSGLNGALLIGGTGMGYQLHDLRYNPRIVIGTPGRIKDHIGRQSLKLGRFSTIVLDEVDRMLDMGFVHDVREILGYMDSRNQSLFFSATIDTRVRNLIDTFTNDPVTITIKAGTASENVHQDVIRYQNPEEKIEKLHDLLIAANASKVLVFDETQRGVEKLSNTLVNRGFQVAAIHGGRTQGQRQSALDRFKKNEVKILVATDVAARGIDVADISHVVNFSIPKAYDDYIHRVGRAGRAGQTGHALTFIGTN